jgi:hypothetical protein
MPGTVAVGAIAAWAGVTLTASQILMVTISLYASLISMVMSFVMQPDMPDLGAMGAADRAKDRLRNVKQPLSPHRVIYGKTRVGGTITYLHTTDDDEELHQLVTVAGHPIDAIESIYGDDNLLEFDSNNLVNNDDAEDSDGNVIDKASKWSDFMYVWSADGTTSGDSDLLDAMVEHTDGSWTTSHKQEGLAKIYTRFLYDRDAYASSLPNITAIVRGKKVFDPRDIYSDNQYSNNSALCILDYIKDARYGLGEASANIDNESFITAANICDENVTLADGTTEKRYVCNGTFETSAKPSRIMKDLLSTCSGRLTYQGGKWALRVGAYVSPTITFTEDDLESGLEIVSQVGRRNLFNQVQSVYTSPQDLYQPTDAPLVKNATYLAQDQNEVITRDMEFPFTTAASTSQRLAKIELERVRQQITVVTTFSLKKGMQIQAGDTIGITNTRMGWTNKAFVVEEWGMNHSDDVENPRLIVGVSLREIASDVFDWNSGEETTVDAAPNTNLPDPFNVRQPTGLSVAEELYYSSGGATGSGAKVRAIVSWASAGKFVHEYEVQYRENGSVDWLFATLANNSPTPVSDLDTGSYNFRVRGATSIGSRSAWTEVSTTLVGLTSPPTDLAGFSVRALDGSAYLSWDAVADLDVIHGGYIRIRHTPVLVNATWDGSTDIGKKLGGNVTDVVLPLAAGTYLAKAVDSTDNFSINAVSSVTTVKNVNLFNYVVSLDDAATGFTGTKTNMVISGGVLQLSGTTSIASSGSYLFSNYIDLGVVYTSRVYSEFEVSSFETSDFIDNRTSNMDMWSGTFDGINSDHVSAEIQVRTTDDNPSASATWTEWKKLLVGDFKARGFQFKLVATSTDNLFNVAISELTVVVDMPDRVERGGNITSGTSTYSVTYAQAYYATPSVGITANSLGHGNHYVISNSTRTGFNINFYSGSGTGSGRSVNFNYQSIGY